MDKSVYSFDSTVEMQLTKLLGIPRLKTPKIKLRGPTTVERSASTAPAPGRFRAELRLTNLALKGKVLGVEIKVNLNSSYESKGAVEGKADPRSSDPSKPSEWVC